MNNIVMYKNIGSSQTIQNGKSSEIQWHTEYDGQNASVLTESTENGKTKYNELTFTNQELLNIGGIINIPKHLESIDVRLLQDYPYAKNDDTLFRHDVSRSAINGGQSQAQTQCKKHTQHKSKNKKNKKNKKRQYTKKKQKYLKRRYKSTYKRSS
jgi:hypothetical protein